jgi:subtilase family serine protease
MVPAVTFSGGQHALAPGDFKKIYNVGPVIANATTGQGITIAVVGRSNVYGVEGGYNQPGDLLNFRAIFGVCCETVYVFVNGPDPGDLGGEEEVEATLDASWAGAMAPNANVDFVVSVSTNTTDDLDLSELYIIDNNLAPIMTESFGKCEPGVTAAEASTATALAEQAAAQGITFIASSGDSGSASCDAPDSPAETQGAAVSFPASIPYTVAVGGTMFKENGQDSKYWSAANSPSDFSSALSYIPEVVWNESCSSLTCGTKAALWYGGGGRSILYAKPAWQTGFGPSDGARDVPDVSFTAAGHDGYLVCLEGSCIPDFLGFIHFAVVAGTSASAPSFAGVMALVDQQVKGPQGQADYVLYRLAASQSFSQCNGSNTTTLPASSCIFNDTTSENNCVPGETGYPSSCTTYSAGVGYDLTTGLGSVNISNLVTNWSAANFNATWRAQEKLGHPVTFELTVLTDQY